MKKQWYDYLWILQCDADFHRFGGGNDGVVQTAKLVCILSDGNDDTVNLQG